MSAFSEAMNAILDRIYLQPCQICDVKCCGTEIKVYTWKSLTVGKRFKILGCPDNKMSIYSHSIMEDIHLPSTAKYTPSKRDNTYIIKSNSQSLSMPHPKLQWKSWIWWWFSFHRVLFIIGNRDYEPFICHLFLSYGNFLLMGFFAGEDKLSLVMHYW